jgi:hypothetical protein
VVAGGAVVGAVVARGAVVVGAEVVETGRAVVVVARGAEVVVVSVVEVVELEVVVTAGVAGSEKIEAGDLLERIPTPRSVSRAKTSLFGRARGWGAEVSVRSD